MQGRLITCSLAMLLGLATPVCGWSADSSRLLAQLQNYDIVTVNQAQIVAAGSIPVDSQDQVGSQSVYLKQLIGIYVDGIEQSAVTAVYDGEQYLLPFAYVLDMAGISIGNDVSGLDQELIRLNTPGGEATLDSADLRLIDGQIVIAQSALNDKLLIDTQFSQADFAMYLVLPWNRVQQSLAVQADQPEAQFAPPSVSIRNLRADFNYVDSGAVASWVGDYSAAGNIAGGTWRFRIEQPDEGDARPFDYFWTTSKRNSQVLVGNSDFSLHPLLSSVEQTGLQYLYSTSPLPQSSYSSISYPSGGRRMANGVRNIEGIARPGAIAELRVDGGVVARTRVRLDGSYDFTNMELPTRGYSEVLVYILDRTTGALLEAQNYSRRSGIELLDDNQHTVFAAVGQQGNPLDDSRDTLGAASAVQWRFGLTEDLTVELGHQQIGQESASEAALSAAVFKNWFASLGFSDTSDRRAMEIDLEGGSDFWTFDFRTREFERTQALGVDKQRRQWSRYFAYRYQLTDKLNLGLVGRNVQTSLEESRFVLPGMSWSNHRNFTVSAYPNISGDYRIDSRFNTSLRSTARYAYENDRHQFDYRYRNGHGQEYYASLRTNGHYDERFELGIVHYSENRLSGRTQLGLVSAGGGIGYTLDWESRFIPGFNSRLRVAKGRYDYGLNEDPLDGLYKEEDNDEVYIQWHMTLDFAVAQNRIVPADSNRGSFDKAALTGEVLLGGRRIAVADGIDQIELIIDGDGYTALVQGGRYYIEGLKPGLHRISLDSRFLPIELMPGDNQNYWVRLDAAAATEVPLRLEARYAIAGRVRNVEGDNIAGLLLEIVNDKGRKVGAAVTDQYGLYRADSLAPGHYYVIARENGERLSAIEVEITDSFLFEQDLLVP